MEKLIITAFRAWRRKHMPRGGEIEIYHVVEFFSGLCPEDQTHAPGSWEMIHGTLRKAGEVECKGDHLSIGDAYVGRPEGRAAWEKWRALRQPLDRLAGLVQRRKEAA